MMGVIELRTATHELHHFYAEPMRRDTIVVTGALLDETSSFYRAL